MSRASQGPANRGTTTRSRPNNRAATGREGDRIKAPRAGWAGPTTAVRTMWRAGPLPIPVAGLAAGLWAALTGLTLTVVLTLLVWIFAAGESASDTALRVGADVWLAAHGTPFYVGAGVWSLMPWAWSVFPAVTLWAAGRWIAHRCAIAYPKSAAVAAGSLAAGYAIVALLAALFGTLSGAGAIPIRAFLHAAVIAFLVSGAGILWRAKMGRDGALRAWRMARPGVGALAVLTLGACVAFGIALVSSYSQISTNLAEVSPGIVGGIALLVGWLGFLPACLMWALSYSVGAGIMVAGSPVTPTSPSAASVDVLGLNLLPVTAQPWWLLGIVTPIAAGVVLSRLAGPATSRRSWLQARAVAVAVVLIAVDLWWFISVGRLGEGRLDLLGPSPLVIPILLVAIVVGIAGEVATTWLWRHWRARRTVDLTEEPAPADEDVPA